MLDETAALVLQPLFKARPFGECLVTNLGGGAFQVFQQRVNHLASESGASTRSKQ
jgi:hypothetical protein